MAAIRPLFQPVAGGGGPPNPNRCCTRVINAVGQFFSWIILGIYHALTWSIEKLSRLCCCCCNGHRAALAAQLNNNPPPPNPQDDEPPPNPQNGQRAVDIAQRLGLMPWRRPEVAREPPNRWPQPLAAAPPPRVPPAAGFFNISGLHQLFSGLPLPSVVVPPLRVPPPAAFAGPPLPPAARPTSASAGPSLPPAARPTSASAGPPPPRATQPAAKPIVAPAMPAPTSAELKTIQEVRRAQALYRLNEIIRRKPEPVCHRSVLEYDLDTALEIYRDNTPYTIEQLAEPFSPRMIEMYTKEFREHFTQGFLAAFAQNFSALFDYAGGNREFTKLRGKFNEIVRHEHQNHHGLLGVPYHPELVQSTNERIVRMYVILKQKKDELELHPDPQKTEELKALIRSTTEKICYAFDAACIVMTDAQMPFVCAEVIAKAQGQYDSKSGLQTIASTVVWMHLQQLIGRFTQSPYDTLAVKDQIRFRNGHYFGHAAARHVMDKFTLAPRDGSLDERPEAVLLLNAMNPGLSSDSQFSAKLGAWIESYYGFGENDEEKTSKEINRLVSQKTVANQDGDALFNHFQPLNKVGVQLFFEELGIFVERK